MITGPVRGRSSYGGLLVRRYVERYGDDVVGLVLVDPTHEDGRLGVVDEGWVRSANGRPDVRYRLVAQQPFQKTLACSARSTNGLLEYVGIPFRNLEQPARWSRRIPPPLFPRLDRGRRRTDQSGENGLRESQPLANPLYPLGVVRGGGTTTACRPPAIPWVRGTDPPHQFDILVY
jgi:pimeloyl-ACP methyl ester carboxylesterase